MQGIHLVYVIFELLNVVLYCRMKPALAQGSFGEVPGNQAWCGGGIPESHRRLGGVPCVVASGVSKTTAGSLPPPTSRCPKDPARAEGSHPCGRSAVS